MKSTTDKQEIMKLETIGGILKAARLFKKITVKELLVLLKAEGVTMSSSYIVNLELNRSMPATRVLIVFARVFNLNAERLFNIKLETYLKTNKDRLVEEYEMLKHENF